jgi:trimeric autotransporter adhesin
VSPFNGEMHMNRLLVLSVLVTLAIPAAAFAQTDPIEELKTQVAVLTLAVRQLQTRATALETANAQLTTRMDTAETTVAGVGSKLARVSVSTDGRELFIDGANLHLRSGSGATAGAVNGYGNLIVGYNESLFTYPFYDSSGTGVERAGSSVKTGSHNIVVGDGHSYTSFGGVVFGLNSRITAPYASVTGGQGHISSAWASKVSGGWNNLARGASSTVVSGNANRARHDGAVVLGGSGNSANGPTSAVAGGTNNKADGTHSTIAGGASNTASGEGSGVHGGQLNRTVARYSSILGGSFNSASGEHGTVGGGLANQIGTGGTAAVVSGGVLNHANHATSIVTGGRSNTTTANDDIAP